MLARCLGEALDQAPHQSLDQRTPRGAGDCPDAEIIAAYVEQGLGADESAHWEGHFAMCARCRNILRVLAASTDMPLAETEVAQLGELVAAGRAPVEIAKPSPVKGQSKTVDWRLRWLAPAFGVAAVLAVWVAMRAPWRVKDQSANQVLVAQGPKVEAPASSVTQEADRLSSAASQQALTNQAAPSADIPSKKVGPARSNAGATSAGSAEAVTAFDEFSAKGNAPTNSLQEEKSFGAAAAAREMQPPAAPPPPPPAQAAPAPAVPSAPASRAKAETRAAATAQAELDSGVNAARSAPPSAAQTATVQGGLPAASVAESTKQKASPEVQGGLRNGAAFTLFPQPQDKETALLKSPSGSTLWRAGTNGSIEKSADAGQTWVPQASPSLNDWLAGTAISDKVCWLVGRSGAIARTTNGERWERVSPPQATRPDGSLPDWVGISAQDARNAVITSADGRKFATTDGGQTWRQQ
jgi:hypothetical protein